MEVNNNLTYYSTMRERLINMPITMDTYGECSLAILLFDEQNWIPAEAHLRRVARWFEFPHPTKPSRDLQGEPDFVAHRLIRVLYLLEQKLQQETKDAIYDFFTRWNFESKYKSENHMLLFHVSRYLFALKYPNCVFHQYQKTSKTIIEEEREILHEFMYFRVRRGWAEFDSLGYGAVCFHALLNLIDFADKDMSNYARMVADVQLLDMIADCSKEGFYGGAHGRVYEAHVKNYLDCPMYGIYQYYFGTQIAAYNSVEVLSTKYVPSNYVYEALSSRPDNWENYECKHLHSITFETPHKRVSQVPGNINKYTYVTKEYVIGAVNWQDAYPQGSAAAWYAHHQQHEWDLSLCESTSMRVFTHHPGHFGPEGKEHGYWTGDLGCCCVQTYCHKNLVMAVYDIPVGEEQFIHTYIPLKELNAVTDGCYLWFQNLDVYGVLWCSNGFAEGSEQYKDVELISYGKMHGVVCYVVLPQDYDDFDAFQAEVKSNPPNFIESTCTLSFRNMKMNRNERYYENKREEFPYPTYKSPIMNSAYGSGIIEVDNTILDFAGWGNIKEK